MIGSVFFERLGNKGSGKSKIFRENMESLAVIFPALKPGESRIDVVYIGRESDEAYVQVSYNRSARDYHLESLNVGNNFVLDKYHIAFQWREERKLRFRRKEGSERLFVYRKDTQITSPATCRQQGLCPKCATPGTWVRTALVCPIHGAYAGF